MPSTKKIKWHTERGKFEKLVGPPLKLHGFNQGAQGCIFKLVHDRDNTVTKIEVNHGDSSERHIMAALGEGVIAHHIVFSTIYNTHAVPTPKPNTFKLKNAGKTQFFIPQSLVSDRSGGCTKFMKALSANSFLPVIVSQQHEFTGSLASKKDKIDLFELANQIEQALDYMKEKRVIHRDIKPENIYYEMRTDGTPLFALGDFGFASFADQSGVALATNFAGTPGYMNIPLLKMAEEAEANISPKPQQCSTFESDRFALGATLLSLWPRAQPKWDLETDGGPLFTLDDGTMSIWAFCTLMIKMWTLFLKSPNEVGYTLIPDEFEMPRGAMMKNDIKDLIAKYYLD